MNRDDFTRMIHNTTVVDRQTIGEVRELIDLFPYFQSAHLLLLKGLNNTSDVKFESQLKKSAIYVADRERLYYLLKEESQLQDVRTEIGKSVNIIEPVNTENQQTVIESGKNSQELINEFEKNDQLTDEEKESDNSPDGEPHSLLLNEESEDDSAEIVFLLNDDNEPVEERIIYLDPSILVPGNADLLELDLQEEGAASSAADHTSSGLIEDMVKSSKKQVQSELIDKFIIANPKIEPVRDKSGHPLEDISKPFTEEKGGFITETLARIYINQGYYSKAIDIYERLSLKFPEKSSYFATQIEKIKTIIK
jgi:tetratricopeptide (TPR) repeat protein